MKASPIAASNTIQLIEMIDSCGKLLYGMRGTSSLIPKYARAHPAAQPAAANTKLSTKSWPIRRQRLAPSAEQMASS